MKQHQVTKQVFTSNRTIEEQTGPDHPATPNHCILDSTWDLGHGQKQLLGGCWRAEICDKPNSLQILGCAKSIDLNGFRSLPGFRFGLEFGPSQEVRKKHSRRRINHKFLDFLLAHPGPMHSMGREPMKTKRAVVVKKRNQIWIPGERKHGPKSAVFSGGLILIHIQMFCGRVAEALRTTPATPIGPRPLCRVRRRKASPATPGAESV